MLFPFLAHKFGPKIKNGKEMPQSIPLFSQKPQADILNNQSVALQEVIKNPHILLMVFLSCSSVKISKTKLLSS